MSPIVAAEWKKLGQLKCNNRGNNTDIDIAQLEAICGYYAVALGSKKMQHRQTDKKRKRQKAVCSLPFDWDPILKY